METTNKLNKSKDKDILDLSDEEFRRKMNLTKCDFVEMMQLMNRKEKDVK